MRILKIWIGCRHDALGFIEYFTASYVLSFCHITDVSFFPLGHLSLNVAHVIYLLHKNFKITYKFYLFHNYFLDTKLKNFQLYNVHTYISQYQPWDFIVKVLILPVKTQCKIWSSCKRLTFQCELIRLPVPVVYGWHLFWVRVHAARLSSILFTPHPRNS